MLEVKQLCVSYPSQSELISDLSFQLKQGQTLWLKGPNGSGKTTLLYALCNIIPQMIKAVRTGKIRLNNEPIDMVPLDKLIPRISLALSNPAWEFLFSNPGDEIVFALENIGLPEAEIESRISDVCQRLGLQPWLSLPSFQLSQGWQKLVVLAVHLAIQPAVLLLDEALTGLSGTNLEIALEALQQYTEGGGCLIIAEHSDRVQELKPSVLSLNGKLI
jgi:energy-coupling factor transporter ATP-binding protein EcfA2